MYDFSKRVVFAGDKPATAANVITELKRLDPNTQLFCCGAPGFVLHVDSDDKVASIDNETLDDVYEVEE